MVREGDEDVVAVFGFDEGGVVEPVFPGAPFAEDFNVAIGEGFDEFDLVVGDFGGGEDFAHRARGGRGEEVVLGEEEIEAEELAHGRGVRVVADGAADAFAALAVMFADPDAAAARGVVEAVTIESGLNLAEA